jgi:STE24 endopeptidase
MTSDFIRKVAMVIVSFISNAIVVNMFLTLAWLFTPIDGWDPVLKLKVLLRFLHIAPNPDNVIMVFTALLLLVPIFVYRLELVQRAVLWLMGARPAEGQEKYWLESAFSMVCEKNGMAVSDYKLYVVNNGLLNAFAFGRNHIAVTRPLLQALSKERLAGVLAHEVGHLVHGDTQMMTLTYCMQNVGLLALNILNGVIGVCGWVAKIPYVGFAAAILSWMLFLIVVVMRFLVNLPANLVMLFFSRQDEYAADRYACELGLGSELHDGLEQISEGEQNMKFPNNLLSTHPDTENRLKRIDEYLDQK